MNFMQWRGHLAKKSIGKVTYVCGEQTILVELVVEDIRKALEVPVTDFISVKSADKIWDLASQFPLDVNANRLIVVRDAELMTDWENLDSWLEHRNPNNYIVFVSYKFDAPAVYAKGKRVSYEYHIETIRAKGKFIKCSTPNEEDLVKWCQTYGLSENTAKHLVQRVSGDTTEILNVLRKVHIWKGSPNTKAIDLLCEEQFLDSFADYLILKDKQKAYAALLLLADKEKIIAKLDSRLELLSVIGKYVRRRMYAGDIAANTGINVFLVKRFMSVVRDYDDKKIRYCRQVLASIDSVIRNGAKVGTYESLIGLW